MSFVRRFGILILGVVILAAALVFAAATSIPAASYGWTAYAPLSSTAFRPVPFVNVPGVVGSLIGLLLIAGWIGFRLGRRAVSRPSEA